MAGPPDLRRRSHTPSEVEQMAKITPADVDSADAAWHTEGPSRTSAWMALPAYTGEGVPSDVDREP